MNVFKRGDRVKLICEWKWPTAPEATVISGPGRSVTLRTGREVVVYYVGFDTPVHDSSEDGPYSSTEAFDDELMLVSEQLRPDL